MQNPEELRAKYEAWKATFFNRLREQLISGGWSESDDFQSVFENEIFLYPFEFNEKCLNWCDANPISAADENLSYWD
ncbi:hypothetical protein [Yersinia aldovae]|uniref:hypothetical protein n=1 Tax=Yersinia aldovae TaxID=29483 RepID=UPI00119FDB2B|nr:hypothetical protein [Yersinia aldovae]